MFPFLTRLIAACSEGYPALRIKSPASLAHFTTDLSNISSLCLVVMALKALSVM